MRHFWYACSKASPQFSDSALQLRLSSASDPSKVIAPAAKLSARQRAASQGPRIKPLLGIASSAFPRILEGPEYALRG